MEDSLVIEAEVTVILPEAVVVAILATRFSFWIMGTKKVGQ